MEPDLAMAVLISRVEMIEARQRAYGMHDPTCQVFVAMRAPDNFNTGMFTPPCTCWLRA